MQKYSIVEFIEENNVEIILSSWISSNNKTALWPKNITPAFLRRHLKNSTVPSDDWSSVNIRVLGHTGIFFIFLLAIFIFILNCSIIIYYHIGYIDKFKQKLVFFLKKFNVYLVSISWKYVI